MEDLYKPVLKTQKSNRNTRLYDNGEINDEEIDEFKNVQVKYEKPSGSWKTLITQ